MTPEEIADRIQDIIADIDDLANDTGLSTGEILLRVAVDMIAGCGGCDQTPEERVETVNQFCEAIRQRAASA